jgi:hypothetical protein
MIWTLALLPVLLPLLAGWRLGRDRVEPDTTPAGRLYYLDGELASDLT